MTNPKPREFWIDPEWVAKNHPPFPAPVHVREVLDPDPLDAIIEENKRLLERQDKILAFCKIHLQDTWAAMIAGMVLDCDFREVKDVLAQIEARGVK